MATKRNEFGFEEFEGGHVKNFFKSLSAVPVHRDFFAAKIDRILSRKSVKKDAV